MPARSAAPGAPAPRTVAGGPARAPPAGAARVTLGTMAATRPSRPTGGSGSRSPVAPPARTLAPELLSAGGRVPSEVSGAVRPGRRTKLLVKHLVPGDIALIDHLDIDRVSAEELIAAEVAAVVNCRASSSGTYPNLGPLLLVEAGILLVDMPDDRLFDLVSDGDPLVLASRVSAEETGSGRPALRAGLRDDGASPARIEAEVLRRGELLGHGEVLDLARVRADTEARRREVGEALERFANNTIEHMRDERELLTGRIALPRFQTDFRDRSTLLVVRGRRAPARPARAASVHPRQAAADRRRRRRRGRGARGRADPRHDRRRHGLGGRGRAALRRRARRPRLSRRPRPGPPAPGGAGPAVQARAGAWDEPGRRDADRRREGRAADRLGRLAVQPRRVPGPQPQRHVLDVPHAAARGRDPRRRQGREPPLPAASRDRAAARRDRRRADRDGRRDLGDARTARRRRTGLAEAAGAVRRPSAGRRAPD